jgi:hypothetical protein
MSAEEAGDIYMAYGGRSASYTGLKPETAPRQRSLMELAEMSHAPVERYSAQEYRNAAAEYRARMGRDFSRDSIYNGLWTRAAAQDGAVGKGWGQDVVNDMTGVATEAGVHAQTGMATGAAAAGMAARRGNHSGIVGSIFGANGGVITPGKLIGSTEGLTTAEQSFIGEMVSGGKTVQVIPATNAGRTADFFIDGTKVELKTMTNVVNQTSDGLSKSLSSTIMNARGQSGNIIIDARGQAGMTPEIAERGIGRAFGNDSQSGSKIQSVTVITPQGTVYIPRKP